jgi:hypothetical protein
LREGQLLPVDGKFDNIFEVINTTFPAGHLRNGNYTLNLSVSDQLGQQKDVSMNFTIARNSPQIFINSYYEKEKITLDVLLEGHGSKIVYAKYAFLEESAELQPMPLAEGNTELDSTSERFTIEFDPDDLDNDKTYRLYIHTIDEAGNANSTTHILDLDNYTFTFEDPYKTVRDYLCYAGVVCGLLAVIAAVPLTKTSVQKVKKLQKTVEEQDKKIKEFRDGVDFPSQEGVEEKISGIAQTLRKEFNSQLDELSATVTEYIVAAKDKPAKNEEAYYGEELKKIRKKVNHELDSLSNWVGDVNKRLEGLKQYEDSPYGPELTSFKAEMESYVRQIIDAVSAEAKARKQAHTQLEQKLDGVEARLGVYQPPQTPEEFYRRLKDKGVPEHQINVLREKGLETSEDLVAYFLTRPEKVKLIRKTTVSTAKKF